MGDGGGRGRVGPADLGFSNRNDSKIPIELGEEGLVIDKQTGPFVLFYAKLKLPD